MRKRIHRRNMRQGFLLSRKFAAIMISLGFGFAFGELLALCWFDWRQCILGGAMFGAMFGCFYDGLMQDLERERERRRVYRVGGSRR